MRNINKEINYYDYDFAGKWGQVLPLTQVNRKTKSIEQNKGGDGKKEWKKTTIYNCLDSLESLLDHSLESPIYFLSNYRKLETMPKQWPWHKFSYWIFYVNE